MKAIMWYPNVVIEEKEVDLTEQEAAKLPDMGTHEKANLILEKVLEFPIYDQMSALSLIEDALDVGTAKIELKKESET